MSNKIGEICTTAIFGDVYRKPTGTPYGFAKMLRKSIALANFPHPRLDIWMQLLNILLYFNIFLIKFVFFLMVSNIIFLSVLFLGFEPSSSLRVHGKAGSVLWGRSHSRKWVCGCVAGQCGALWSADGGYPSLWPGPTWLLPDLWLRLQSWSAQPSHFGTVFSQTLIAPEFCLWLEKTMLFSC